MKGSPKSIPGIAHKQTAPASSTRRRLLAGAAALFGPTTLARRTSQRVVVVMLDGFGLEYLEQSSMPVLGGWRQGGIFSRVKGTMPSVTNTNNASICCGVWPERHGITGNSYFDERTGRESYMETADLLLAPTIFERARRHGVKSALLASKKKTTTLLSAGAEVVLAGEAPSEDWSRRLGPAPDIYSREINYWLLKAAIDLLKWRRDLGCMYVHTTDYPMHNWPPEAAESNEHLARLDELFRRGGCGRPGCRVSADGRSRYEPQESLLGSGEGVRQAWRADSYCDLGRAGQISASPSRLRGSFVGLLQRCARR